MSAHARRFQRFQTRPELAPQWWCVKHRIAHRAIDTHVDHRGRIRESMTYRCGCVTTRTVSHVLPASHFTEIEHRLYGARA